MKCRFPIPTMLLSTMLVLLLSACDQSRPSPLGLEAVYDGERYRLRISQQQLSIYDRVLQGDLLTVAASDLVQAHRAEISYRESNGTYQRQELRQHSCHQARIDRADPFSDYLQLVGHFRSPDCEGLRFFLRFAVDSERVLISVYTNDPTYNQLSLGFDGSADEVLMGLGAQTGKLNFNGSEVPIWSQRQGIGRGEQPISRLVEDFAPGASGHRFSSPAAVPALLSSHRYSLLLENSHYARFDFRQTDLNRLHVDSPNLQLQVSGCPQLADCVAWASRNAGASGALPAWAHRGVLLGLGGGSAQVLSHYRRLQARGVPVAGLWVDDWMGLREPLASGFDGRNQHWQLDRERYADWQAIVNLAAVENLKLLGYFSPRLQPAPAGSDIDLFEQALDRGYLVRRRDGSLYMPDPRSPSGLVDLNNPEAYAWLQRQMLERARQLGLAGWLADHATNLPTDADLGAGGDALSAHNRFALLWARLNREVAARLGNDSLFALRAASTTTPALTPLLWLGHQNTSWDAHDGLQSALTGLINAGLSGQPLAFASTGGITSMQRPLPPLAGLLLPDYLQPPASAATPDTRGSFALHRKPNLLQRWLEVSAFTPIFHTHEGLARELNAQVYDEGVEDHFRRFARIFAALAPYRQKLLEEVDSRGLPLVRHPILVFPDEHRLLRMKAAETQFMLGDSILVAPKLTPRNEKTSRPVFLPAGKWLDFWTLQPLTAPTGGLHLKLTPPLGRPPVYLRDTADTRQLILPALRAAGLVPVTR